MCGIAGILYKNDAVNAASGQDLNQIIDTFKQRLLHRGPDEQGAHQRARSGFVNARLAIVDIAGGSQPIFSADQRIGIVYNGEIYNFREVRGELEAHGIKFTTDTDTEVVLRGYEHWGVDAFKRFNGMFAFCIWDEREDAVYLVRDRFGIKPLYLYQDESQIIFSSEIRAILSVPSIDRSLDARAVQDYLTFRYIPAPYTLFQKIASVEAGSYMRVKAGIATQHRFATLNYQERIPPISVENAKRELCEKLSAAVKSQLMGEVPIGVLLSGGIDSSAIAYFVHQAGANLTTYNIGFPDLNEFEFSRQVAKQLGLRHVEVVTTPSELLNLFDEIVAALDSPMADPACFPLYRLCQEIKREVTVVLSGESGDELFAGYPQYGEVLLGNTAPHERYEYFLQRSWYFSDALEFLRDRTIAPLHHRYRKCFEGRTALNAMLSYDMHTWMPENLMMKADKMLMAHSLEGRFPFHDLELFEFAASLPEEYKLSKEGVGKWILKEALKDKLPMDVLLRPKMGFSVPVEQMLEVLKDRVLASFSPNRCPELAEIVDVAKLRKEVEGYYAGSGRLPIQIWTWFILFTWVELVGSERYLDLALPSRRQAEASP